MGCPPTASGTPDYRSAAIVDESGRGDNGMIVMISVWTSIYVAPGEREKAKRPGRQGRREALGGGGVPFDLYWVRGQSSPCVTKEMAMLVGKQRIGWGNKLMRHRAESSCDNNITIIISVIVIVVNPISIIVAMNNNFISIINT